MPFRSKAQQRFMFAAEARGELPKGTAREWAHETDDIKKLPERIHKKKRKEGKKEALAKFGLDLSWAQPMIEGAIHHAPHAPEYLRQVIQEHPLLSMAGTGAATGVAGWKGGRLFQATKDTGANLAHGLWRGGAAVGQGIQGAGQAVGRGVQGAGQAVGRGVRGAGQSLAGLFRKRALDEHDVYSGPPSFRPVDTAETISSEAGKLLDERRDDGRTDLKNAPVGVAILGNKEAAMTPAFIRSIARDADVEVGQPEFKEKVRGLTGKVTLEEMTTSELQQVAKMIWSKEAAEKKKKKRQTGSDKLLAMTSGRGAAGAATPIVTNAASYLAAHESPRSGKRDFSRPDRFEKLTKRMGTGDVPKFHSSDAGMGHAKVTVEDVAARPRALDRKTPTTSRTEKRWAVGLPPGASEATAAHELGHVRNWQAVENAIGAKDARKLMGYLGKLHDATMFTSPVASAYSAIDDDMSLTPGLAQLAVSSPRLLDEALASGRAVHHLIGRHGALSGLREGATLLPAFGTYAAMAGAPLAITGARRLWRRWHPDDT